MSNSHSPDALERERHRRQHPALASLSRVQVADVLALSTSCVDRLLRRGDLQSFKVGRARRVTVADLERFIERERCT